MTEDATRSGAQPTPDEGPAAGGGAATAVPAPTPDGGAAAPRAAPPADPPAPTRRALKLVVRCKPEGDGYRVLLALGADGCDPVFRTAAADGLTAALDEVPALAAEAEERWRAQPRYPVAAKSRSTARREGAVAQPAATPAEPASAPPSTPGSPSPTPGLARKDAPAGQMALFG